jgi:glycosyltransferase involved in cell wall biosynthesis
MVMNLYITADKIGVETGGGIVTKMETEALSELGNLRVINPEPNPNPFDTELQINDMDWSQFKLAHFYSGTFPTLVEKLKKAGVKVVYTCAAHDKDISQKEHERYGYTFSYPHLTDPVLWQKYLKCYLEADVLIVPSKHSADVMQKYGCRNIVIIPHGCNPMRPKPLPKSFNVGYLGQIGYDKGLPYLLEAWGKLNYKDATLHLAGRDSLNLLSACRFLKKGNIVIHGYVKSIEKYLNSLSVYVQPSVTEGFGIEVLEAINCHRPVVVSDGAGSADCVGNCGLIVPKKNVSALAEAIDTYKNDKEFLEISHKNCKENAAKYTWRNVKDAYKRVWSELL